MKQYVRCFFSVSLFFLVRRQLKIFENYLEEQCSLGNLNDRTEVKFISREHAVIYWETGNKDLWHKLIIWK